MPDVVYELSADLWDRLHDELIEAGDPVSRMDRERMHLLYALDRGPILVFLNVGFSRAA